MNPLMLERLVIAAELTASSLARIADQLTLADDPASPETTAARLVRAVEGCAPDAIVEAIYASKTEAED